MGNRASFIRRIRLLAVLFVIVGALLVFRLWDVQIVNGARYRERAETQYTVSSDHHFDRGSIFFTARDGSLISAATLEGGYTLALIPRDIVNASEVFTALSSHFTISSADFFAKASKKDDPYEELAVRVPLSVGEAILKENIPGVGVYRERWRLYPGDETAAHSIGFLGYGEGDTLIGQYGLERFYDGELTKNTDGLSVNFFADVFSDIRSAFFAKGHSSGADLVTSIEPTVQKFIEEQLNQYENEWHPEETGAIVLDPHTGEIVALATLPSFDPNDVAHADPSAFSNRLVERVYEFGSIMKPLTIAAGIDAGVITPETTYRDRGYAVYDGARIANFDGKGRGVVTMQDVLSQSLNTGVAFVVEKLGTDTFRDYLESYGITEETGVDLPNEAEPLVKNLESPRTIEYVTASFGQGFAVTPLAMARSLAALANGGTVPTPHVGNALRYPGGFSKKLGWAPERRAISESTAETVTRMLVSVVDTALQGGAYKIPELSIAAKTGTAQIAKTGERGYYDNRYIHSFFGYFPAYEPRFLVFLYSVAPQGALYSSQTWTKPFMESVRFLVSYYNVPPDRVPAP